MKKFEKEFEDIIPYPINLYDYLNLLCTQVGVTLGSTSIINGDYIIIGNPFTNGENCKTILSQICELAGGYARIGRDNKLYIHNLQKENPTEIIDGNVYDENLILKNKYNGINQLTIQAVENVEGENTIRINYEAVDRDGKNEIKIIGNSFLTSEADRERVIDNIWLALKGISYIPFETNYYGFTYLDSGDLIELKDRNDTSYLTYILNHEISYSGIFNGKIYTPKITSSQTIYQNTAKNKFRQVEFTVNKIDGKIESLIKETEGLNTKYSTLTQTVEEIRGEISNVSDITTSDSGRGEVILERVNEGEPVYINIRPIISNIEALYPSNEIYPSNDIYPRDRLIYFLKKDENNEYKIFKTYKLPCDLYYINENVYDEFVINYDTHECYVIHRVDYNDQTGEITMSNTERREDIEYPSIILENGDYKILTANSEAYIYVRLMAQNIYTNQFATKVELNSKIQQTANEINLSVDGKLGEYAKTKEVNASLSLKVDLQTLMSTLNAKADEINFESNTMRIISRDFKLENGQITAVGGKIGGFTLSSNKFSANLSTTYNFTSDEVQRVYSYLEGNATLTEAEKLKYDVNADGVINVSDVVSMINMVKGTESKTKTGTIELVSTDTSRVLILKNSNGTVLTSIGLNGIASPNMSSNYFTVKEQATIKNLEVTGSFSNVSDRRYKKDIEELDNKYIKLLNDVNAVKFKYKDDDKEHLGFIAQDMQEAFNKNNIDESIVDEDFLDKLSLRYTEIIPILWKINQEQQKEINTLNEKINRMEELLGQQKQI